LKDLVIEDDSTNFVKTKKYNWKFFEDEYNHYRQKVRHCLSIFYQEWFYNRELGIPYIPDEYMDNSTHRRMIETAIQERVLELEKVEKITEFEVNLNKATRNFHVSITVKLVDGTEIESEYSTGA